MCLKEEIEKKMSYTPEEKFQKLVKEGKYRKHDNGIDRTLQLCNFDEHQIDLGCQTFHKHFFSMFVTMLTGKVIDTKYPVCTEMYLFGIAIG